MPIGSKILSIILYSDATNCDTLGKSQLHPIYLSLGNIPTWQRNKQDAKQLLGYLPIIKSSNLNKQVVRQTFHRCLEIILEPIQKFSETGINLLLNSKDIWFYPKVLTIITDWPKAVTFCLTYKSTNSKYSCHFCSISRDDLANTILSKHDLNLEIIKICKTIIIMMKKNQYVLNQCQIFFGTLSKYNFYLFLFYINRFEIF